MANKIAHKMGSFNFSTTYELCSQQLINVVAVELLLFKYSPDLRKDERLRLSMFFRMFFIAVRHSRGDDENFFHFLDELFFSQHQNVA